MSENSSECSSLKQPRSEKWEASVNWTKGCKRDEPGIVSMLNTVCCCFFLVMSKIHEGVRVEVWRGANKDKGKKKAAGSKSVLPYGCCKPRWCNYLRAQTLQCCGAHLTSLEILLFEPQDLFSMGCICFSLGIDNWALKTVGRSHLLRKANKNYLLCNLTGNSWFHWYQHKGYIW